MKILYVTTISNTVNAFLIPHIKLLADGGHRVDVAFNIEQELKPELKEMGCKVYDLPLQRSPLSKDNFRAYKMLKKIIFEEKYDLVHTHTPVASFIVRLVCKKLSNVKVFYTAHGFHFYKGAPLKNWLFYYPLEKWLARYTDTLITINKEDYERAKISFKARRIEYIPGVGLDTKKFSEAVIDKVEKRKEIGMPEDAFLVLSVGELNNNKNHETIIRAISNIDNPKVYYIICGLGVLKEHLECLSEELGIEKQVRLLGFRTDIAEICKASDVFAFPSMREGLGMAALEAMACGLPILTSNVHGIVDYSIDGITGYTCNPPSYIDFSNRIDNLLENKKQRNKMALNNSKAVKKYDIDNVLILLTNIYQRNTMELKV